MNPIKFAMRHPVTAVMLVVALLCGGVYGLYRMRVDIPFLQTTRVYAMMDDVGVKLAPAKTWVVEKYESITGKEKAKEGGEEAHHEEHKLVVTTPIAKDVKIIQQYVCQIHSRRHIDVCALQDGYLEAIPIREGQEVKAGEVLFQVLPTLYQARLDAEVAEVQHAQYEYENAQSLRATNAISQKEVLLLQAKLSQATAKMKLAQAELNFCSVKAPFDGIVNRLMEMQGSLVKEGDILTTLSDNSVMWVYFNVPEKRYLQYMAEVGQNKESPDINLVLANHNPFDHPGKIDPAHHIGAIGGQFNNETGNIAFRADFPNPERLLRHGQTGTVQIKRDLQKAIVIPQRATFENLAKRYVYIVDKDDKVHQKEISIQYEQEDIFIIDPKDLTVTDKIVFEGIRQVREGEKVEFELITPEEALAKAKYKAE